MTTHPTRKRLALFFKKVQVRPTGCWEWTAARNTDGYGSFNWAEQRINTSAHRIAHMWFVGSVAADQVVDHLCRNPGCVNPVHLEAVSYSVNSLRGLSVEPYSVCSRGHAFTDDNVFIQTNYGQSFRTCLICRRLRESRRRAKRHALKLAGTERAQLDAIFSEPSMRVPFVVAMAEIAGEDVEVSTTITIRKHA